MTTPNGNAPRRRKPDRSVAPVSSLPVGNPPARVAYICAVVGLIPGLGLLLGPPALILGVIGRRRALRDELRRGLGHAYVSRIAGAVETACNAAGLACLARSGGWL